MLKEIRRQYFLGLDLAQVHDFSALSVIEREDQREILGALPGRPPITRPLSSIYTIRDLQRWRKVSYKEVARQVHTIFRSPLLRPPVILTDGETEKQATYLHKASEPVLVMDATSLGGPVRDDLRELGLTPVPVTITKGNAVHPVAGVGVGVPKRDLAQTLLVLLNTERLRISGSLPLLAIFKKELSNFRMSITQSGYDTYGASSGHDDLVLATSLALWYAEMQAKKSPTPSLPRNLAANIFQR